MCLVSAVILAALVRLNQRKVNTIHPNNLVQPLAAEQAAQAKQLARDFFNALGKGDWEKIDGLCRPGFALGDRLVRWRKDELAGLQLVSLGEPFKKPPYPGIFVPYEIKFKDGSTWKFNLAVRNDNPERKWYFDRGLQGHCFTALTGSHKKSVPFSKSATFIDTCKNSTTSPYCASMARGNAGCGKGELGNHWSESANQHISVLTASPAKETDCEIFSANSSAGYVQISASVGW